MTDVHSKSVFFFLIANGDEEERQKKFWEREAVGCTVETRNDSQSLSRRLTSDSSKDTSAETRRFCLCGTNAFGPEGSLEKETVLRPHQFSL